MGAEVRGSLSARLEEVTTRPSANVTGQGVQSYSAVYINVYTLDNYYSSSGDEYYGPARPG